MTQNIARNTLERRILSAGLSEKSARVYATLAYLGNATPSVLAKEASVNRSTAYKILTDLSIKGLISELQQGKKLTYQIESPNRLIRFAESREKTWREHVESAKELLPDLEALISLSSGKPKVRFYQGIEGVKDIYRDHVSQTHPYEMLGMSNVAELQKMLPVSFLRAYIQKKVTLEVTSRGILPGTETDKKYRMSLYAVVPEKYRPKIRHVTGEAFPFQGEITLYGEKSVSCINFSESGMAGVIIEDEIIAKMLRLMFELAWRGTSTHV